MRGHLLRAGAFFTARHTACPQDLNLPYNRAAGEACAAGAGFKSCYPHHKCEGICFGQVPFLLRGTVCRNANTSLTHAAGDSFRFPVCSAPKKPPGRIPVRLILPGAPL